VTLSAPARVTEMPRELLLDTGTNNSGGDPASAAEEDEFKRGWVGLKLNTRKTMSSKERGVSSDVVGRSRYMQRLVEDGLALSAAEVPSPPIQDLGASVLVVIQWIDPATDLFASSIGSNASRLASTSHPSRIWQ
jgi:hypothetical protein